MARNGNGTYVSPVNSWNPQVQGSLATAPDFNAQLVDIGGALSQSISNDGQTTIVANIPMNNNKITGLSPAVNTGDAVAYQQIFGQDIDLTLRSLNSGQLGGLRNRFINGAMKIDQRNLSAAQTIAAGALLAYTVDRWFAYCKTAAVVGQQTASTADQFVYQFTGAPSCSEIGFGQRIEAANCYDFAGKKVTLSVDLQNSLLTTVNWVASYANTTDTFGSIAAPTKTQIATGSFTVTNTLTRYNAQITIPSAAVTGVEILFTVGAQVSGTWQIGKAQIELGTQASIFEERVKGDELQRCQYYCPAWSFSSGQPVCSGMTYSANAAEFILPFQNTTRVPPTSIVLNVNNFSALTTVGGLSAISSITINGSASSSSALSLLLGGTAGLGNGNGTILYCRTNGTILYGNGCEL